MNREHPLTRAGVVLIVGRRGSGKSELLRRIRAHRARVVVADVLCGDRAVDARPRTVAYDAPEYFDALRAAARQSTWDVVARPDRWDDGAEWLAAALLPPPRAEHGYASAVGGVTVACDEADVLAPNSAAIAPEVRALVQRGRHYRISILAATRRPAECHRDLSSQADALVTFAQHEPRDLAYLAEAAGERFAASARELRQWSYAVWLQSSGEVMVYSGRDRLLTTSSKGDL